MNEIVGQMLGQYQVVELIGQGGMARVYKAFQPSLQRYVAIKALPTQVQTAREESFLKRFIDEARVVARLNHPNIIPVHDFGQVDDWAYIVMEYVSGGTVRERLAQAHTQGVQLSLEWVLLMGEQAAYALDCAHRNGIVHRDVKPGNMLLRTDKHLLLSDFGIAQILASRRELTDENEQGTIGTPQYMAPEQGASDGVIDPRTDIYSLGVVLYQCIAGQLPFVGDTPMTTILKHIHQQPPNIREYAPDLPPVVDLIIRRAMAKFPEQRYQSAAEMATELYRARVAVSELRASGVSSGRTGARRTMPTIPREMAGAYVTGAYPAAYAYAYPDIQHIPGEPDAPGTCFRCGAANNPSHRFCTSCGYDLSGRRAQNDTYLAETGRPLYSLLTFSGGPLNGRWFRLHQDRTTVGRAGGNDIVIPDGTVSRKHAVLTFARSQGAWYLEDLGSSNGTFVNDAPVKIQTRLRPGDRLRFGDEVVQFDVVS